MAESEYKFDDPKAAFAEAQKRIETAIRTGAQDLRLDHLGLTELPELIGELRRVETLGLDYNRLSSLPKSIAKLTQLRSLFLDNNKFAVLPSSIGHLSQLRVLTLGQNLLSGLPDCVGQLARLEKLFLLMNNLTSLPDSLRKLAPTLIGLYLAGNEALGLPTEIVATANPADILDYYFRIRGGARPLNEAKLILLGRGEVGKTALVNRLVRDEFKRTSMTRGISITPWLVTTGKETVRFNVWDFGGHEIQHATHQFFLTERRLYLVVLNGRAGAEDEDAEYWLKFIKTFGGSSPTIVVLNKIKVQPFQVNRRALQEKYPFIRAFVETDCKTKTKNGRPELIKNIKSALETIEYVRASFPADWFRIKERLAKNAGVGRILYRVRRLS